MSSSSPLPAASSASSSLLALAELHRPRAPRTAAIGFQGDLFARGASRLSDTSALERVALDATSTVVWGRGWLLGAEALFDQLLERLPWKQEHRQMYDRVVRVPRWIAPVEVDAPWWPVLRHAKQRLEADFSVRTRSVIANYYRDGAESVAFHSDRESVHGHPPWTLILSLGGPRRLAMKPANGGSARHFTLGSGDLFVIGSRVHDHWHHGIPKVRSAPPRMSIVFFCEALVR